MRPPIFNELALSRAEVDRLAELRGDLDLMDALLNDSTTRILAVIRAEAPVAAHDAEAALILHRYLISRTSLNSLFWARTPMALHTSRDSSRKILPIRHMWGNGRTSVR
jgi:hypothetical protein